MKMMLLLLIPHTLQERMRKNSMYARAHHVVHCINVSRPGSTTCKLSEHTDSSGPRNADPQGERGDRELGDNEAYFSANFKSVQLQLCTIRRQSRETHAVLTDDETGIIHESTS